MEREHRIFAKYRPEFFQVLKTFSQGMGMGERGGCSRGFPIVAGVSKILHHGEGGVLADF